MQGDVAAVVSEDSDLIVFEYSCVFFKMDNVLRRWLAGWLARLFGASCLAAMAGGCVAESLYLCPTRRPEADKSTQSPTRRTSLATWFAVWYGSASARGLVAAGS